MLRSRDSLPTRIPPDFGANYEGVGPKSTAITETQSLVFIEIPEGASALLRRNELFGGFEVDGNQF